MSTRSAPPVNPDGCYIVVRGRLRRRAVLTAELMDARLAVGAALRSGDAPTIAAARASVDAAKIALGERGPAWRHDSANERTRRIARNTAYADRYASLEDTP